MRCIYCLREDVPFEGKEHVMSQFLGTFSPDNLILKEVCDRCNSKVISKLETIFKEDSVEGFVAAQYQLRTSSSIRFRNKRLKFSKRVSGNQRIFDSIFPTIDPATGKAIPTPQIVIEGKNGKIQILFLKGIKDFKRFAKKINWTGVQGATISIFGQGSEVGELIQELRNRGVNYKENENENLELNEDGGIECEFSGTIDRDIERFICKLAFNYFAYCAINSGLTEVIYENTFNEIRDFVIKDEGRKLVIVKNNGLSAKGYEDRDRIPFHFIGLKAHQGKIMAEVSIFGHLKYVVEVGKYPFKTGNANSFGLGHIFNVLNKSFHRADIAKYGMGNNQFSLFSNIAGIYT